MCVRDARSPQCSRGFGPSCRGIPVCRDVAGDRPGGAAQGRGPRRRRGRAVKLSVVVPVRNERDTIVALLERLRAVDCGMPKEIIVVDGASTDGTREALLGLADPDLVLVLEDRPRGKGRAVRTGFERA